MMILNTDSNFLSEEELEFLDEALLKYGNDHSLLNISALDGFLTAVVSGPNMILPSQWYPAMWGGAGCEPAWENQSEMQRFMALVMQHMNSIADVLVTQPENFEALFYEREFEGEHFLLTDEWCEGYMLGTRLDQTGWAQTPPELVQNHLSAIHLFSGEFDDQILNMSNSVVDSLQSKIEPAVRALHAYWLQQRTVKPVQNMAMPVRAEVKVGRNAPCPCGSGRKFKQCCLH